MMQTVCVVFGANGYLGRYLCRHFARQGREVVAVCRRREGWSGDGMLLEWDGRTLGPWAEALEGAEAVINLAGREVEERHGVGEAREILEQRLAATRVVGRAITACRVAPRVWLQASGSGVRDEWLGGVGEHAGGEARQVAEEVFYGAACPAATRKVLLRLATVLAAEPGTLFEGLKAVARCGLGGSMAGGAQRMSWIHMEDFLRAVDFLIADPFLEATFHVAAPEIPSNEEWMRAFREQTGTPMGLPASRWMVGLAARVLRTDAGRLVRGCPMTPLRLRDEGFRWHHPQLAGAIADLDERGGLEAFFAEPSAPMRQACGWLADPV
jgi:uncharacterized protein